MSSRPYQPWVCSQASHSICSAASTWWIRVAAATHIHTTQSEHALDSWELGGSDSRRCRPDRARCHATLGARLTSACRTGAADEDERTRPGDIRIARVNRRSPGPCADQLTGRSVTLMRQVQQQGQRDHVAEAAEKENRGS